MKITSFVLQVFFENCLGCEVALTNNKNRDSNNRFWQLPIVLIIKSDLFISSLAWDTQSVDNIINHWFFLEAQGTNVHRSSDH